MFKIFFYHFQILKFYSRFVGFIARISIDSKALCSRPPEMVVGEWLWVQLRTFILELWYIWPIFFFCKLFPKLFQQPSQRSRCHLYNTSVSSSSGLSCRLLVAREARWLLLLPDARSWSASHSSQTPPFPPCSFEYHQDGCTCEANVQHKPVGEFAQATFGCLLLFVCFGL